MKKVSRTFRIPADLVERFDKAADARGIDKTEVVVNAIKKFVEAVELERIWDADRYVVVREVYAPVLGKCEVMSDNNWLNPPEGDRKSVTLSLRVLNAERKDDEGTRYNIEDAHATIDFVRQSCIVDWRERWIGGLVERKELKFAAQFELKNYTHWDTDVTEITVTPSKSSNRSESKMRVWEREGYKVVEKEFDHDLHEFDVVKDGEVIATITPADLDDMARIVEELDAGEDVNGWEDGMGNTISL